MNKSTVIKKILRYWNPIGIDELPNNEYDSYAPKILDLLQKNATSEKISNHLASIRSISIGLGENIPYKKEIRIANILVEWRKEDYKGIPYF